MAAGSCRDGAALADSNRVDAPVSQAQPGTGSQPTSAAEAAAAGEAMHHSIRSRSIRGSILMIAGYGGTQLIRFGSNLILTRLLFEEAFGAMAMIQALIIGLHLFSDIGIGPSIIQHERGDDRAFLDTAWTMQVIRGFVLGIIALLLAYPAAEFFYSADKPDEPYLLPFLLVSAIVAPIDGLTSTAIYTLNRHLSMGRFTMIEIGLQIVTVVVTVAWAWFWPSVWALVGGNIAGVLFRTLITHWLNPFPNRFHWDSEAARHLLKFGRWIFLSTLLVFLADHAQPLIFAAFASQREIGIYNIAVQLALLAPMVIQRITSQVFFPAFSRLIQGGIEFRPSFLAWRRILYLIGGYLVAGMVATGQPVIDLLYDPRWIEAGWMLQLVAAGMWLSVMHAPTESALLALGHSKWMAAGNLSKIAGIAMFVPTGFHFLGFGGAILGMAMANGVKYATIAFAARLHHLPILRHDFQFTVWVAATGIGVHYLCQELYLQGLSTFLISAAGIVAVSVLWLPVALTIHFDRRRQRAALA